MRDDAEMVEAWIRAGRLGKPSAEQLVAWDLVPAKRFQVLIVSPYILVKELAKSLYSS